MSVAEGRTTGFDVLFERPLEVSRGLENESNGVFNRYIAMHKIIVGQRGARQLVDISTALVDTDTPDHLVAAGWAATEAALVLGRSDEEAKEQLTRIAKKSWVRAVQYQRWINGQPMHPLNDTALIYRAATNIAFLPVYEELINGGVRRSTLNAVNKDVLNIAQIAGAHGWVASRDQDIEAVSGLRGVGYELNGILAYNYRSNGRWFAMPAIARADSGVYHPEQTHDLLVVRQDNDGITDAIPIEMKATASRRQRARYASLLVRAKLHMALPGKHHPDQVLDAITAEYEDTADSRQHQLFLKASQTIFNMVGAYLEGEPRRNIASQRGAVQFRHNDVVRRRFPGLSIDVS